MKIPGSSPGSGCKARLAKWIRRHPPIVDFFFSTNLQHDLFLIQQRMLSCLSIFKVACLYYKIFFNTYISPWYDRDHSSCCKDWWRRSISDRRDRIKRRALWNMENSSIKTSSVVLLLLSRTFLERRTSPYIYIYLTLLIIKQMTASVWWLLGEDSGFESRVGM